MAPTFAAQDSTHEIDVHETSCLGWTSCRWEPSGGPGRYGLGDGCLLCTYIYIDTSVSSICLIVSMAGPTCTRALTYYRATYGTSNTHAFGRQAHWLLSASLFFLQVERHVVRYPDAFMHSFVQRVRLPLPPTFDTSSMTLVRKTSRSATRCQ